MPNLWITGHPTEALRFGQNALALAESLRDAPLQVTGHLYLGAACLGTGDYGQAADLLRNVLQLLEGDLSQERVGQTGFPAVIARGHLTWVLADRGEFEEGIAHGQEGLRLAEAFDEPYSLAFACWRLAHLQIIRGDLSHAVGLLKRGVALSREWNLTLFSVGNAGSLGHAYALSGRVAEAIPLLEHAVSAVETIGSGAYQSLFLIYLGEAYALDDRLEDALDLARRALTLARERGQRGYEAWALRLLGEVTARRDPRSTLTATAVTRSRSPGSSACARSSPTATSGLSKISRRTGKRQQAQEHLTIATTMYREMEMPFWLDKAKAEAEELV